MAEHDEVPPSTSGPRPKIVLNASERFSYPRDVRKGYNDEPRGPKDPHPEVEGDVFDRQRVIECWDQSKIESQVCFVLGTGGLGQDVAMGLARLGVAKIILLDYDTYDVSNLTRQVLGGIADVGMRKVDVGRKGLMQCHNLRSEIETMNTNAVTQWGDVVAKCREAGVTALFNCVDYGAMFDQALNALSKELHVPYVSGSSFSFCVQVEYYTGLPERKCWRCNNAPDTSFAVPVGAVREAEARLKLSSWLAARKPSGGSGGGGGGGGGGSSGGAGAGSSTVDVDDPARDGSTDGGAASDSSPAALLDQVVDVPTLSAYLAETLDMQGADGIVATAVAAVRAQADAEAATAAAVAAAADAAKSATAAAPGPEGKADEDTSDDAKAPVAAEGAASGRHHERSRGDRSIDVPADGGYRPTTITVCVTDVVDVRAVRCGAVVRRAVPWHGMAWQGPLDPWRCAMSDARAEQAGQPRSGSFNAGRVSAARLRG